MDALDELEVWQRSKALAVDIYKTLHGCTDHGFKNQITRASVSIASNVAEGYERNSKKSLRIIYELQRAHVLKSGHKFILARKSI